jgi:hypothetical protein
MFEVIGGRKFIGLIITLAAAGLIEVFSKNGTGLSATMAGLIVGLYTTFSASNVIATLKTATAASSEPPAVANDNKQLEQAVALLLERQQVSEQNMNALQQSLNTIQKAVLTIIQPK